MLIAPDQQLQQGTACQLCIQHHLQEPHVCQQARGLADIQDSLISPWQTGEKWQARELQHPYVTGLRAPQHFPVPVFSEAFLRRALRLHSRGLGTMSGRWHGSCSTGASLASTERLLGQTAEQRNQYYSHALPLAVLVYAPSLLQQASPSERRMSLSSGATTLGHCEEHHGGGRWPGSLLYCQRHLYLPHRLVNTIFPHIPPTSNCNEAPLGPAGCRHRRLSTLLLGQVLGSASPRDTSPHQVTPCRAAREEMGDPKHDMTWYRLDSSHSCKGQPLKCCACKHFGGIAVYTMWREQAPYRNINRPVTTVFTLHKKKTPSLTVAYLLLCYCGSPWQWKSLLRVREGLAEVEIKTAAYRAREEHETLFGLALVSRCYRYRYFSNPINWLAPYFQRHTR